MEKVAFGEGLFGYEVGPKTAPAIMVVQEWWGVNDTIKEHAIYLSEQLSARCLIPDLYKGTVGVTVEEAQHSMENLDFPGAVKELTAAASYLKGSGSPKVGCIGFCMGGALTLAATQHADDVTAGVVCYGIPPSAICDPSSITKPVSMHFGEEDQMTGFSDVETAQKVEATLKAAGAAVELFTYPGVGHAFLNSSPAPHASFEARKETQGFPPYDSTQAQLAWSRIIAFLKKRVMT